MQVVLLLEDIHDLRGPPQVVLSLQQLLRSLYGEGQLAGTGIFFDGEI